MKKFFIYVSTLIITVFILLLAISKAIEISSNLREIHVSLEIIFYVLLAFVLFFFILKPLFVVIFSPYYSINNLLDNKFTHNKKIVKKLIKKELINSEKSNELLTLIKNKDNISLNQKLKDIYNIDIKKKINETVVRCSKETMFLTSISQSSAFDSIIVLINNFRLVKKIILIAGFRPNFFRLVKLYSNILLSTFIADGLEKIDISSLISSSIQGSGKIVTNSIINGVGNAFLMLRIGMLTKLYLYSDDPKKDHITLKNNALLEATKLIPSFISELLVGTVTNVVSSITNIFKDKKETKSRGENNE